MHYIRKIAVLLLGAVIVFGTVSLPVYAQELDTPEAALQTESSTPERTAPPAEEETETSPLPEETEETGEMEELPESTEQQTDDAQYIPEETSAMYSQSSSMGFDTSGYDEQPRIVPLYLQTDYPNTPYSGGSVASSGCSITSIAMVATYLTGEEHLPDELAVRFGTYDASNIQRMEAAATVLDLTYAKTTRWEAVAEALEEDKVAIVMLEKASPFTSSQHMVVLTGITENGTILVNDPYGPNYSKQELIDGFGNGFPPEMLVTGFGQAWIFDEYIPPEATSSRYPPMELTAEEEHLLASIIWLEARGESFEGQQAVAEVVFNRIASGEFSATVKGTIMAEGQFRTVPFLDEAEPGELQYKAIETALSGPNVLPMNVYFFGRAAFNDHVWGTIGGHTFCYGG